MELNTSQLIQDQTFKHSHPLATPAASKHIASIDGLRILAAIGIVWFHTDTAPYRQVAYAGLPIFLLVFFSLITSRRQLTSLRTFAKRRWHRLLKPWLFWSLLYGLFRLISGIHSGNLDSLRAVLSWKTILVGTHVHLWYLPYAFGSGLLVYALHRITSRVNNTAVVLAATGLGLVVLAFHAMNPSSWHLTTPVRQWEFGLAAIPLGFAIGRSQMAPSSKDQRYFLAMISLTTQIVSLALLAYGHTSSVIPYNLAVLLVCLAYYRPISGGGIMTALAPLTFGIYLIHPLIGFGLRHVFATELHYAISIGLTLCLSGLVTLGLMKTRLRCFV